VTVKKIFAIGVALLLAGCAGLPNACPSGLKTMQEAELYFGRDIAGASEVSGEVSDAEWHDFVEREIAPRFPKGFTVEDATGQWQGDDGKSVREASEHVTIVLSGAADDGARLDAIRAAYKRRFRQQSVMLLEHDVCGSF
jgi:hypothetical protein